LFFFLPVKNLPGIINKIPRWFFFKSILYDMFTFLCIYLV
jgi:hypothetical protein